MGGRDTGQYHVHIEMRTGVNIDVNDVEHSRWTGDRINTNRLGALFVVGKDYPFVGVPVVPSEPTHQDLEDGMKNYTRTERMTNRGRIDVTSVNMGEIEGEELQNGNTVEYNRNIGGRGSFDINDTKIQNLGMQPAENFETESKQTLEIKSEQTPNTVPLNKVLTGLGILSVAGIGYVIAKHKKNVKEMQLSEQGNYNSYTRDEEDIINQYENYKKLEQKEALKLAKEQIINEGHDFSENELREQTIHYASLIIRNNVINLVSSCRTKSELVNVSEIEEDVIATFGLEQLIIQKEQAIQDEMSRMYGRQKEDVFTEPIKEHRKGGRVERRMTAREGTEYTM